ncbi:MAG TPA: hypothetical protein VH436_28095 [Vicinamibacterales bacterium]
MHGIHTPRVGVAVVALAVLVMGYAWLSADQEESQANTPAPIAGQPAPGDDLITAASTVRVMNEVTGDVAAAGNEVTIDAPVDGYVLSAGRRVTVVGKIGNDLWAAGETVNIESPIANNAMVAGRTVHVRGNAVIGHDAHLAGNDVTAEGRVERNLTIGAGGVARINANVGGIVTARATRVAVLADSVIRGDLYVKAAQPPVISPQARVMGQIHYERTVDTETWFMWPYRWLISGVALLILGLAAVWFSPAWATHVAATMRTRVGASILSGIAAIVIIPLAVALLALTVIGFPLAVVLSALYILVLALSSVFVSYRTGEWLLHRLWSSRWAFMILGVAIVSLGMSLPNFGWAIGLFVMITGAGALVLERGGRRPGGTSPA